MAVDETVPSGLIGLVRTGPDLMSLKILVILTIIIHDDNFRHPLVNALPVPFARKPGAFPGTTET